jgi:cell division protein FtsI/penicillin-binding protein 2
MKYWPAILSAVVALAVAIPVLHELAPGIRLFERAQASPTKDDAQGQVGSLDTLQAVEVERMFLGEQGSTAPAGPGQIAHLTVDPRMQKATEAALKSRRIPVGGAVLMDLRTGAILTYAAKRNGNTKEDPLTSATAPATDLMKVITATALVNVTRATADTRMCHRDPGKKLEMEDLVEDEGKDTWCPPLSEAFARNLDAPFARAAYRGLDASVLEKTAAAFGFGAPLAFDLPVEPSLIKVPDSELGLVHAAIGAEHAKISAMQALLLASTIASKGVVIRPVLVQRIEAAGGKIVYRAPDGPRVVQRAIAAETAVELSKMMFETTEIGDAFRAFHDDTGHPALGDVKAAGKTGADRVEKDSTQTTWFIGFAPVDAPEVAIATVAQNRRGASGNAQALAVDVLRAYFESRMGIQASKPNES